VKRNRCRHAALALEVEVHLYTAQSVDRMPSNIQLLPKLM